MPKLNFRENPFQPESFSDEIKNSFSGGEVSIDTSSDEKKFLAERDGSGGVVVLRKSSVPGEFAKRVQVLVAQIPKGRVMTYGQIAALCGNPQASRIVGGIAHFGDPDLPWQRVVNKQGGLAAGYFGGRDGHKRDLELEGVTVDGKDGSYRINLKELLWWPPEKLKV
jgi:methylated-DNA-protein-cysteine methyltransferase-like protein